VVWSAESVRREPLQLEDESLAWLALHKCVILQALGCNAGQSFLLSMIASHTLPQLRLVAKTLSNISLSLLPSNAHQVRQEHPAAPYKLPSPAPGHIPSQSPFST
jgi:hypothetical protein